MDTQDAARQRVQCIQASGQPQPGGRAVPAQRRFRRNRSNGVQAAQGGLAVWCDPGLLESPRHKPK